MCVLKAVVLSTLKSFVLTLVGQMQHFSLFVFSFRYNSRVESCSCLKYSHLSVTRSAAAGDAAHVQKTTAAFHKSFIVHVANPAELLILMLSIRQENPVRARLLLKRAPSSTLCVFFLFFFLFF